ncbi:MAG: hypothetical protein AVDCRST_MAG47-280 [uncultured Nocardioidaceae bacterium]|uniref:Uncharacterized protein n=1 Tax=uncultured Nocardioidaceae bacterium TaxID=253824 RepID=A0A6J4MKK5_9ACTN|nr:MAG: hypothetical protein AVDCRST_MAG47-280 [uncultured Nocardioidaceae bacterium]
MWRSGITRRRSDAALLEMIENAARWGSFDSPWHSTPQVWQHFRDEGEILCQLQRQWRTALAGAIYVAIEAGDGDLRADVTRAFEKVQRKHHGLRKILEAHSDHPAIAASMRKERALLSSFVGLSTGGTPQAA